MKKIMIIIMAFLTLFCFTSCKMDMYSKYQTEFFGPFNTFIKVIGYTNNEEEFLNFSQYIYERLNELNQYYDIYNNYDGINNIKTINDNAGLQPVKVNEEIIEMLKFSKKASEETKGNVNIALGSVLSVWHEYRENGIANPDSSKLPPMELLQKAKENTDIEDLVIDEKSGTVYLKQAGMKLDVGAIAKGYAAQVVTNEVKQKGFTSFLLYIGGNIVAVGKPMLENREYWNIGVQDPSVKNEEENRIIDTVFVNDMCIVTSGDYQRYYEVDGKEYHHIIDPKTLMPANLYRSVTVLHKDSGIADMLSTALFILPYEEGNQLAQKYDAAAIWVFSDETIKTNEAYRMVSKMYKK